jgi:hypothetical protein
VRAGQFYERRPFIDVIGEEGSRFRHAEILHAWAGDSDKSSRDFRPDVTPLFVATEERLSKPRRSPPGESRTTDLYDRAPEAITLDEVERIGIKGRRKWFSRRK